MTPTPTLPRRYSRWLASLCLLAACGADPTAGSTGPTADVGAQDTDTAPPDGTADGTTDTPTSPTEYCSLGAEVFDESRVHELRLQLSDSDWDTMIAEAVASPEYGGPPKTYFEATLELDGDALSERIGVRLKGHSSLLIAAEAGHSFPFKLDFNRVAPDQTLNGLTKLNLHPNYDGVTVLNEFLSYGAISEFGMPTARVSFVRVTLNGEDLGLYTMVEQIHGRFVRCHYEEPFGDLYKPEEPIGNLAWRGDRIEDYEPEVEFKWPSESTTAHGSLLELLSVLRAGDVSQFRAVLDVPGVLSYLAANVALGNYDYYASFGHNYYLYESEPAQFTMIAWDMNFSQGLMDSPCGFGRNTEEWPVSHWLLGDPASLASYLQTMSEFLAGPGSESRLNARLDEALAVIGASSFGGDSIDDLRATIQTRVSTLEAALAAGVTECAIWAEGGGDECDECIEDECEPAIDACFEDLRCECVADCFDEEEDADECAIECGLSAVPAAFTTLLECMIETCLDACE
jgi:hypothetical protein